MALRLQRELLLWRNWASVANATTFGLSLPCFGLLVSRSQFADRRLIALVVEVGDTVLEDAVQLRQSVCSLNLS